MFDDMIEYLVWGSIPLFMILDIYVLKCKNLKYLCHSYHDHHKDHHYVDANYIEMNHIQYVQPNA